MILFPPTIILRHRKENLKKCSLKGLESRQDLYILSYPLKAPLPQLEQYLLLDFEGPLLSKKDASYGLFLLDGTWRYTEKMGKNFPKMEKRSLPYNITTAYPRRQEDCSHPLRGLATVEALFAAHAILGRDCSEILDYYYWREDFLNKNIKLLNAIPNCG